MPPEEIAFHIGAHPTSTFAARARSRPPSLEWERAWAVRQFRRGSFVGMMFHLPRRDQSAAFESVSRVLKPGASFLFTAAEIDGADDAGITSTMNGVTFRYYAVPSCRELVAEHGFVLVDVHDDPGVSTYFLARRLW